MAPPITGVNRTSPVNHGSGGAVLVLVIAVFFLFGGITNLADLLVSKLKGLYSLSYTQAMLVQFAFFTSYAIFSIPAGMLMQKLGYFRGIMIGLGIMIAACLLFMPAASSGIYATFLGALFLLGGGITLLQVAVNPLILQLGPPKSAHSRLTFAQFFNSLGVFLIVTFGAKLILGGELDPAVAAQLTGPARDQYVVKESAVIGQAYLGLAVALAAVSAVFWTCRKPLQKIEFLAPEMGGAFSLLKRRRVAFGCICIFLYVGAEVGLASIMVSYLALPRTLEAPALTAGLLVGQYWAGAMVRRMAGGVLLRLAAPGHVLFTFAVAAIGLISLSGLSAGAVAGFALVAVGLANSIMFPTIFSLATEGLREEAPQASGLLCTAIVGGAMIPLLMGVVSDAMGLTTSLLIPVQCYTVIAGYGSWAARETRIAASLQP